MSISLDRKLDRKLDRLAKQIAADKDPIRGRIAHGLTEIMPMHPAIASEAKVVLYTTTQIVPAICPEITLLQSKEQG